MRATMLVFLALMASLGAGCQSRSWPANALLGVNGHSIDAEVAATSEAQERGLMGRRSLDDGHGMLFVFPSPRQVCMWMRNTPIPLSVAFLSADSQIVNIADMRPNSDDQHCASEPVAYALEVPLGIFSARGIRPGDVIDGLPSL